MDNALGISQLQKLRMGEVTSCDINLNYVLAIGFSDKNVRILEWKTGLGFVDLCYSPLNFHKYAVTSVRFSPKGTILASASLDGSAILIDVLTGSKIYTAVQDNTSNIKFCEFTFDSRKLITASDDGVLCFWDLFHHRQIRNFRLHEDDFTLRGFALSPDSDYLLIIDSGNLLKLSFIGVVTQNQPKCLLVKKNVHDDASYCEFSPVKNIIGGSNLKLIYCIATCGSDGWVKIWEVAIERKTNLECCDLRLLNVLKHDKGILSVRFNPGGNYILGTRLDNIVTLWEVQTGNCLGSLRGHGRYVTSAVFSKDSNLLATGSIDKTLIIWALAKNLSLDSELLIPCNVSCHFTNINAVNYHTPNSGTNQEKKYKEFNVLQKLTFPSVINCVYFQDNDVLTVAGGQKTIEIWKKEKEKLKYNQKEKLKHETSVNYLDGILSGGKVISCSTDGMIIFWNLNMSLTYKMETPNCIGGLRTCKFSPDSKFIVAGGDDQKVYMWDANNLEFLKVIQQHENAVTALAFTPDGKFLVSTCGSDINLQNFQEEKQTAIINNAHDLGVLCCDFSSNSDTECQIENGGVYHLATGGNDSLVKLWDVTETEIKSTNTLSGHGGTINCVKFSSTEPFILASCSSDTTVRIWDVRDNYCLHVLNYHQSAVTTCSFSKDSILLATGSLDKCVFILNLTTKFYHEPIESDDKLLENWTSSDIANWFLDIGWSEIAEKIQNRQFSGRELFNIGDDTIADYFELASEKEEKKLKSTLLNLKKSLGFPSSIFWEGKSIPHKFLCPITHQIMKDPVICTDGYVYDRSAITEWFLTGKLISPVTKESLTTTKLLPYSALKINIHKFLQEID